MSYSHSWPYIINLGNSIIGVAMLAMPFCFQKCGILLCMLVLLCSTWLNLIACQLLMKAGVMSRRRSYEFLAFHTHGATGKLVSEIGMIGYQFGTLIAQIVVIGDLGPSIVTKLFGIENIQGLRTSLMIVLCMTIGLPMALLRDIRAVSRVSVVCVAFYCIFVFYVLWLALPNLWSGDWYRKIYFWRPQGLFQSLPIMSFSFGCQSQLFLVYEALPEPSLKTMSNVVNCAINMCAVAYLLVGFCGYIAFYPNEIPGDVIGIFPNTAFADLMKVCFVFSIVITFPVMVFPCRASIYTLLYAKPNQDQSLHLNDEEKKSKGHDDVIDLDTYIPPKQLRIITVTLVVASMIIGILIPNVEFILGMNGAIMGTIICFILPALFYLKVIGSKMEGRNKAQLVLFVGVAILLVSTYTTLKSQDIGSTHAGLAPPLPQPVESPFDSNFPPKSMDIVKNNQQVLEHVESNTNKLDSRNDDSVNEEIDDIRKEPPNPHPPDNRNKPPGDINPGEKDNVKRDLEDVLAKQVVVGAGIDQMAAVNAAKELEQQVKEKKQEELLAQLEKQSNEQKLLIEEQKQLIKEFKDHHYKDMKNGVQQPVVMQNEQNQNVPKPEQQVGKQPQENQYKEPPLVAPQQVRQEDQRDTELQNPSIFQQQINGTNMNQQLSQAQQDLGNNSFIIQKSPENIGLMNGYVSPREQQPQQQTVLQQPFQIMPQPQTEQQQHIQQPQDLNFKPNLNEEQNKLQQDVQQEPQNRAKREANDQAPILNLTKASSVTENHNSSFNTNQPSYPLHTTVNENRPSVENISTKKNNQVTGKDMDTTIKENISEEESDANSTESVKNDTEIPRKNEEMRRKIR